MEAKTVGRYDENETVYRQDLPPPPPRYTQNTAAAQHRY